MRNAANQANNAYNQANQTSEQLGAAANGIGLNLTPFLTEQMLHPEGLGQEGIAAETAGALGGAGGAASGLVGSANQRAAASRNAGGFQAALDDVSRDRMKAAAGASEGIQAQNENLKQEQQQNASSELGKLYGVDTSGMLNAMGQEKGDIETEIAASQAPEGWMSETNNLMNTLGGISKIAGGFGIPGFQGFRANNGK